MKPNHTRFIIGLVCLIVALTFLTIIVKNAIPQYVTPHWIILITFFTIVSVVIYFLTVKMRGKGDNSKFTLFYMGTTIAKLMLYLAIIVTYALISKDDAKSFIMTFLAYYLCYTTFETYSLTKLNKD
ncbi:MAG: hypothetical protein IJZ87_08095 [Bacteroidales bacterium]|nr:hypothetical protein [Bacteroidales bacterium]